MIQNNLFKAGLLADKNFHVDRELEEAQIKVKSIHELAKDIRAISGSNKSAGSKEYDIHNLTSKIMALTQDLDND